MCAVLARLRSQAYRLRDKSKKPQNAYFKKFYNRISIQAMNFIRKSAIGNQLKGRKLSLLHTAAYDSDVY